ncbi:proliferating cell nuclear antigen (pcna) [Sulfurisphaera ohwakuensis]|uniref:DNA polymerase sliding clamp 1 n=2 Tax=Sulfurisphaera ohwakuensis TaxID=69656 RepID=PCNA1_SULOH|nr:proliferating cell nuclear antigen (pcna) [Sulfurisphaera ohwakuensis]P57762.1 RecName: Full=DNA polymerase sliding clamp 1; AltName: Full=Proliferating cell nuclear antigen homolog 1; Short=PCNA 1 [Sulfurisphaera ohwakuensis]MBB5253042.1 proliferating cell nuclear antigen [Sulfurisphaera ohwakuensis]QGR16034.1 proliferating cell nuclear antigen (pcna) [Sulfurisphaera ohwakuensis]BAB19661.1 proliferating cell nuclear antigen A [Sulfurisphaera ohwakuensis]
MRIVYDDVRDLKAIVQALLKLVDEALFDIKPEGIQLVAIDKAHISLIKIELPKEMFKEYDVPEEFKFGFNTQYMSKLLKAAKRKEEIIIEADSPEVVKLTLSGALNRVFNVNNIEVLPPEVPEVNLEFDIKATINASGFKNAIGEIAEVADTLLISANEEKVIVKGEGENKVEVEFSKDTGSLADIEFNKESSSAYDVEYLNDIISLTKLSDYVKVAFAEQKPMQLEFNMEGGGKVTYLLAPKLS